MKKLLKIFKVVIIISIFLGGFAGIGFLGVKILTNPERAREAQESSPAGQEQDTVEQKPDAAEGAVQDSPAKQKSEIKIDVTSIMNRNPSEVEKVIGKPDSGLVPYPPDGFWNSVDGSRFTARKASYGNGFLEAIYIDGKLARVTINSEQSPASAARSLESFGICTDKKPFLAYDNVTMWMDVNGYFKVMVFNNFIQIITDIKYS